MKKTQHEFIYYGSLVNFKFIKSKRRLTRENKPKIFKFSTKYN